MKLKELLSGMDCLSQDCPSDVEVSGIACDSRRVRPGAVFIAIHGTRQDGVGFIENAISRGAVCVVLEGEAAVDANVGCVRVADARRAAAQLAAAYHGNPGRRLKVVGITGTNGKTTTAFMIRDILNASTCRAGMISTVQYEIGSRVIPASRTTPDATMLQGLLADMVADGCDSVVMEVSSHALMQQRVAALPFDVGLFTNLSRDHLDYHGSMDAYFEAKALLFRDLGHAGKAAVGIVGMDNLWGRKLLARDDWDASRLSYGLDATADVRGERLTLSTEGSTFTLQSPWGRAEVQLRLLGRYNVQNALAALATACTLGVPLEAAVEAIGRVSDIPGRLERVPTRRGFQVFVDYAHTDDALLHVLVTVREVTRGRLILVFGCGGDRDASKRPLMGAVAAAHADHAIITSDNPRSEEPETILEQIRTGFGDRNNYEVVLRREDAIARALDYARPKDVVLIAGKGHETFQELRNTTVTFDDRQVVRNYLTDAAAPVLAG